MENTSEHSHFEITPTINQTPFESEAVGALLKRYCILNGTLRPQVIDRSTWEEKEEILEAQADGTKALYLPRDLALWEMVGVMEAIDHDTFAEGDERRDAKKEELLQLGKTFRNAGVYITERLERITDGKEIARALAKEFYDYGSSLMGEEKHEEGGDTPDMSAIVLTPEEIAEVDRFLAGDTLYASRQAHGAKASEGKPEELSLAEEEERQRTLAQFFRVSEKAFVLKEQSEKGELDTHTSDLKAWQSDTPIHTAFLSNVEDAMKRQIERPKTQLGSAVFRQGMEMLEREMPFDKLSTHAKEAFLKWENGETTLREALDIDTLKSELRAVRNAGDMDAIVQKEDEIANKIQRAVSAFRYHENSHDPAIMVLTQQINCVGASMLGGALLSEVGVSYLVGDAPEHSILILVRSDGKVEWRDMRTVAWHEVIDDTMIEGMNKEGKPLTAADIAMYAHDALPEGLFFHIQKAKNPERKISVFNDKEAERLGVFPPEVGQELQVLNNTGLALFNSGYAKEAIEAFRSVIAVSPRYASAQNGLANALHNLGRDEEAVKIYQEAIVLDPKVSYAYNGLGNTLFALNQHEAACAAFQKAIELNPKEAYPYNGLGNVLLDLGRNEEALESYERAIALDVQPPDPYNGIGHALMALGRKEEAVAAFKEFILRANKNKNADFIARAEKIIAENTPPSPE